MIFTENRKIVGELNNYDDLVKLINKKSKNNLSFKHFDNVKDFFDKILSRKSIGIKQFIKEWRLFYSKDFPNNGNRHVNYYLVRGYNEDEAIEMINKVQSNVSAKSNRPEVIRKRVESWKKCKSEIKTQRGRNFYRLKGLSEEEIEKKMSERNSKWMNSLESYIETTGDNYHERKGWGYEEMLERYGEEKAKEIMDAKGTPFENFKKKYGDEWQKVHADRRYSKKNLIKKYGLEIGTDMNYQINLKRLANFRKNIVGISSKIELDFFQRLDENWQRQKILKGEDGAVFIFDFYNEKEKILIEFQGDYWHCNPNKYVSDFYHPTKNMYAYEVWEYDLKKKQLAEKQGWVIEYVWESNYREEIKTRVS